MKLVRDASASIDVSIEGKALDLRLVRERGMEGGGGEGEGEEREETRKRADWVHGGSWGLRYRGDREGGREMRESHIGIHAVRARVTRRVRM